MYFNQQVGQAMAIYQTLAAKNSESASKATQSFYKEQHNPEYYSDDEPNKN